MSGFKKWTESDDSRIRELHATGISLSRMAVELGLTRGQVHGRVWQLGLKRRPKKEQPEGTQGE